MRKKFKFHCLDDESDSEYSSKASTDSGSDDFTPDSKIPGQLEGLSKNHRNIPSNEPSNLQIMEENIGETNILVSDSERFIPPLPSPAESESESDKTTNCPSQKGTETSIESVESSENEVQQETDVVESNSNLLNINSIPEPEFDDQTPDDEIPQEVDEETNTESGKPLKSSIPKSLKSQIQSISREKQILLNTNKIYDYFNHKITKLSILKAIHAKSGDFRSAILELAQNPRKFDQTNIFEAPQNNSPLLESYLK
ncbi:hypothetical protein TRFO_33312 [Tritrichomonas foetus]|uniref:Uncharacterized protein n=1 Tax=Tritrichomonas foetus TaxID=1144522 RepID=A0A1J4JLW6_9EUKA|nr:hypothetical protein TRFO_33312 [Tritrichomonas foetus]|eukprot:OHT00075.1 hypothetical protein TRFO_33312 [Tritrichomonas foetus]